MVQKLERWVARKLRTRLSRAFRLDVNGRWRVNTAQITFCALLPLSNLGLDPLDMYQ